MNKPMIAVVSATLLVAGCVSPQSQNALAALQGQCAAGNRDACTAAGFQAQANQQEFNNSSAVAAGLGAALLGAAVVGSTIAVENNHSRNYYPGHRPEFHQGYRPYGYR